MVNVECEKCGHLYSNEKFKECPNCPSGSKEEKAGDKGESN